MPDFTQLRRAAGLTKEEAAIQTGYTLRTIRRWEKGETSPRKKQLTGLYLSLEAERKWENDFVYRPIRWNRRTSPWF